MLSESRYVGVDGCKAGWVSIGLDDGDCYEVEVFTKFHELASYYSKACVILVDIPIGLVENGLGKRVADSKAEGKMGRRNGSIFHPPSRERAYQLARLTYEDSSQLAKDKAWQDGWKGFAQVLGIISKIVEVDHVMTGCKRPLNVREVHPEICFWALNEKEALSHSKKAKGSIGVKERLEILKCHETKSEEIYEHALALEMYDCTRQKYRRYFRKEIARDDILDALVAAVTAKLGCQDNNDYTLKTLPPWPPRDSKDLPMEMVYAEKAIS